MEIKETIQELEQSMDELTENIKVLSDHQNGQFTDIMMLLKKLEERFDKLEDEINEIKNLAEKNEFAQDDDKNEEEDEDEEEEEDDNDEDEDEDDEEEEEEEKEDEDY